MEEKKEIKEININDLSIIELKSIGFDLINELNNLQNKLNLINQTIINKQQEVNIKE